MPAGLEPLTFTRGDGVTVIPSYLAIPEGEGLKAY